jgi:hypothetical protein
MMTVLHMDKRLAAFLTVGAAGCFILGIIIGHFATSSGGGEGYQVERMRRPGQDKNVVQGVLDKMDTKNIRNFLEILSKEPHIAASERDRYVATLSALSWNFSLNKKFAT